VADMQALKASSNAPDVLGPLEGIQVKNVPKWSPEEDDLLTKLRGQGMLWNDIAKHLHYRSAISCRLRYQNYLERRTVWTEDQKNALARLYARYVQKTVRCLCLMYATISCGLIQAFILSPCLIYPTVSTHSVALLTLA
jgi:hypothetical protein